MTEENEKNVLKNSEEKKTVRQTKERKKTANKRPYYKKNIKKDENENNQNIKNDKEQEEAQVEVPKRVRKNASKNNSKKSIFKKTKLKIIPLGGLHEIGKNITVFEYENDIVIVDCGIAFPEDEMLGVDLVIPENTWEQKIDPPRVQLSHMTIDIATDFINCHTKLSESLKMQINGS